MKLERPDVPYTQVTNIVLQDKTLSWKARGIFAYLFSKPSDWDFSTSRMKDDAIDGRDSLLAGVKELEDHGYLKRVRQGDGRMKYVMIYGQPESEKPTKDPESEIPTVGNSHCGKSRPVSNKEVATNKEEEKNKEYIHIATPKDKVLWFFRCIRETPLCDDFKNFLQEICDRTGLPKGIVWQEVKTFVAYWTEPTPNGKKTRWELEKTFEISRRLNTWFLNKHRMAIKTGSGSRGKGIISST